MDCELPKDADHLPSFDNVRAWMARAWLLAEARFDQARQIERLETYYDQLTVGCPRPSNRLRMPSGLAA